MNRTRSFILALLLSLPVLAFLLHHFYAHSPGLQPTGFTVDENVLYMSYARQYLDDSASTLFYSNPFDGNPKSPAIYFQPVNFILALGLKTGLAPGMIFSIFGFIMAVCAVYLGIRLIVFLVPRENNTALVSSLFTWGGGLTALTGIAGSFLLSGYQPASWLDGIYLADPARGWWALNWGRNLFIPLEAYYHAIFLLNILLLLKKKWAASVVMGLFLSVSHPFTGIEYLLIINAWIWMEKIIFKNADLPAWFLFSILAITIFHCWFYLLYLNGFEEHRTIFSQYSEGWTYSMLIAIAAYSITGALALFTIIKFTPLKRLFSNSYQRLFFCWALVAFLLSKHEWFIKPMQPIHFTRGYVWAGLFLFSLPGLCWLINYLKQPGLKKWLLGLFVLLFLSDNILWTSKLLAGKYSSEWEGHISNDTREVLDYLEHNGSANDLLIGNASLVNYLANAHSPVNAWISHPYNTPSIESRNLEVQNYLTIGKVPSNWEGRRILVLINKKSGEIINAPARVKLMENDSYILLTP